MNLTFCDWNWQQFYLENDHPSTSQSSACLPGAGQPGKIPIPQSTTCWAQAHQQAWGLSGSPCLHLPVPTSICNPDLHSTPKATDLPTSLRACCLLGQTALPGVPGTSTTKDYQASKNQNGKKKKRNRCKDHARIKSTKSKVIWYHQNPALLKQARDILKYLKSKIMT